MRFAPLLPFGLLALATSGHAAHLELKGRRGTTPGLRKRTSMSGTMTKLNDTQNMVYLTDVSLNGKAMSIMIDTGSSDLWVSPTVPGAVPKNFQCEVNYASGSASGDVMAATFEFAGFSIEEQYFISSPDGNAAAGADGLIGLGPSSGSGIRLNGKTSAANPPLDRIFTANSSISPYIAILLQRASDPDEPYPGDLGVGEVLSNYQAILDQPRHTVSLANVQGGQHWQTLLDVDGLIGPNGQSIPIKTQVTGAQSSNATVVFDTGFTLPQVSPDVAQALYGSISGAVLRNDSSLGQIWYLPCDQEVTATFLFAGVEFPIHPLDLNFDGFGIKENGQSICVGAFQPYSFDIVEEGDVPFDMILGMAFLRNAYMLINFGNLLDAATPQSDSAYIQLLPITNATEASKDFARVRGGNSTGYNSGNTLAETNNSSKSHSTVAPWVIGVIAGAALALASLCFALFRYRRRRGQHTSASASAWMAPSYQPINRPSPQAAYDMHMSGAPGYNAAYAAPQYKTAWDSHY